MCVRPTGRIDQTIKMTVDSYGIYEMRFLSVFEDPICGVRDTIIPG